MLILTTNLRCENARMEHNAGSLITLMNLPFILELSGNYYLLKISVRYMGMKCALVVFVTEYLDGVFS